MLLHIKKKKTSYKWKSSVIPIIRVNVIQKIDPQSEHIKGLTLWFYFQAGDEVEITRILELDSPIVQVAYN